VVQYDHRKDRRGDLFRSKARDHAVEQVVGASCPKMSKTSSLGRCSNRVCRRSSGSRCAALLAAARARTIWRPGERSMSAQTRRMLY
jgi:hypothetical protein